MKPKNLKLEHSADEAQVLVNVINEAVKAKGLEIAEAGVFFYKKIQEAHAASIAPKKKNKADEKAEASPEEVPA